MRIDLIDASKNFVGWLKEGANKFSVKIVYELQAGRIVEERWTGWKLMWKLRVQQRVKDWVWLLAHGGVLTNEAR